MTDKEFKRQLAEISNMFSVKIIKTDVVDKDVKDGKFPLKEAKHEGKRIRKAH